MFAKCAQSKFGRSQQQERNRNYYLKKKHNFKFSNVMTSNVWENEAKEELRTNI